MNARPGDLGRLPRLLIPCVLAAHLAAFFQPPARAIEVVVDYRYDTNKFFTNNEAARNALQAAADRYGRVITSELSAVNLPTESAFDPRIGFTHPGSGNSYRISTAASSTTDSVITAFNQPAADEYRPITIAANQWILYAGGRDMAAQAAGGQLGVVNFPGVFSASDSVVNRTFRSTTASTANLPVWGGSIAFDSNGTNWHFDHATPVPNGAVDFYSFALHEIGHALGLNRSFLEWTSHITPGTTKYRGQAVDAYNGDNDPDVDALNIESAALPFNPHWDEGAYDSYIFSNAGPNYVDTVGSGALQDLLMEVFLSLGRRFELTNVDVAALRDVGWSTVEQLNPQPGDFNGNGVVEAGDYVLIGKGLATGTYATWRANFGESLPPTSPAGESSQLPEPSTLATFMVCGIITFVRRRRTKKGDVSDIGGRSPRKSGNQ